VTHLNLLGDVEAALPRLSRSERRVAELVLAHPAEVVEHSIMVLARRADVSEPTIVRFCRSVGCSGFQDLKVRLAQSLGAGLHHLNMDIEPGDGAAEYIGKVFDANISTLISVRNRLDADAVSRAVEALARARKIEFYGFVASGAVAMDAQHKFFHFAVPCVAYTDLHMQLMSAAALGPEDVVVAISHTGRTRDLVASVSLARRSGATVIGVTDPDSPLGQLCSIVVGAPVPENTDVYMPTLSRIAHLLVIDVLAVGVALRGGPAMAERLERMKEVLHDRRLPLGSDGGRGDAREEGGTHVRDA
jgi:RpiR family transcriptional regulator, carbohydrate utilization regulator